MKGVAETALVAMIIAVAAGLVVFGATMYFVTQGKGKISIEACRSNVQLAAKDPTNTVQVNQCYTKDAGELKYSGNLQKYEDEVSEGVAGLLRECMYQFGEAQGSPWGRGFTDTRMCFVCSTFQLPPTSQQSSFGSSVKTTQIATWMMKNNIGTSSYLDYLAPRLLIANGNKFLAYTFDVDEPAITPYDSLSYGESYAAVSFIDVESAEERGLQIAATKLGLEDDPTFDRSVIFITKTSELGKACEVTFLRYP
jgi:hypothetical protein